MEKGICAYKHIGFSCNSNLVIVAINENTE